MADVECPEPCLIGFQQFMSLKAVVASDVFVVVLSKFVFEKPAPSRSRPIAKRLSKTATQDSFDASSYVAIGANSTSASSWSLGGTLTSLTSMVLGGDEPQAPSSHASAVDKDPSLFLPTPGDVGMSSSWVLYALSPVALLTLVDEMTASAAAQRSTNPSVYFILLFEAFNLLQTKVFKKN